ncbi:MAG: RidA family protein [Candidatus Promineifilaceae bacterium]
MTKQAIIPPSLPAPRGFNHGFICSGGKTIFLAGQDAGGADGKIVCLGDIVGQYEQVLKNLQAVMVEAGGTMQDIVKMNIFVSDRDDYVAHLKELGTVHKRYFGRYYPATALLEVVGFYQKGNLVEIEGIAYID